jgi:putative methyltransferase (TIGR04325 family)
MISFRDFIPPIFIKVYGNLLKRSNEKKTISCEYLGDYKSWEEAVKNSTGYNSELIFLKVRNSLLKVKNGESAYERDSVLFDKIEYSYPLLAGLMWIAARNGGSLNVIDFGGSLGSTYFQNRLFLKSIKEVHWNIIEQSRFVEIGKSDFEDESLTFFYSVDECLRKYSPNVLLFSGVMQYLKEPYDMLKRVIDLNIEFIIFDRTIFNNEPRERLTIQEVSLFNEKIPCWFLDENKFITILKEHYDVVIQFNGFQEGKGYIFKHKNE